MRGTIFGRYASQIFQFHQFLYNVSGPSQTPDGVWFDCVIARLDSTAHISMAAKDIRRHQSTLAVGFGSRAFVPSGRTRTRIAR